MSFLYKIRTKCVRTNDMGRARKRDKNMRKILPACLCGIAYPELRVPRRFAELRGFKTKRFDRAFPFAVVGFVEDDRTVEVDD